MLVVVMTRARSFMRQPQVWQCSTSILKVRINSSRQGRYPERWVGRLSLAVQVEQPPFVSSEFRTNPGSGTEKPRSMAA
jgi:hypothetical protein